MNATSLLERPAPVASVKPTPAAVPWWRSLGRMRPELALLLLVAGVLNLWGLSENGWANEYYSAAVRSMSSSWHAFLYGSFDAAGAMTVDKPPLSSWVQVAFVKVFGFHSLSLLVPQALMGVASVALVYDLTRRLWGRPAGFVAGLALATTPIAVAISRHNNPDALLILCCVGALWATVRGAPGRPHALAGARGRLRRPGLRGEDGGGAAGRAGHRRGVAVDRPARAARRPAPAAGRRRGDGRGRGRVAAADRAHAGGGPAVGVGHERQQHRLADLRLQRPRPPQRPGGWPAGVRRRRGRRRRPVRRPAWRAAAARLLARRAGRLAARLRARRRPRHRGREPPAARRRAHRLADRRRRRCADLRGRLQRRLGHLPSLLRLPARALRGRAGGRGRGADPQGRRDRPRDRRAGDRRRRGDDARRPAQQPRASSSGCRRCWSPRGCSRSARSRCSAGAISRPASPSASPCCSSRRPRGRRRRSATPPTGRSPRAAPPPRRRRLRRRAGRGGARVRRPPRLARPPGAGGAPPRGRRHGAQRRGGHHRRHAEAGGPGGGGGASAAATASRSPRR